jgi:hypothetical protein
MNLFNHLVHNLVISFPTRRDLQAMLVTEEMLSNRSAFEKQDASIAVVIAVIIFIASLVCDGCVPSEEKMTLNFSVYII